MEFIITLLVIGYIYKKVKKAAGIQKKLTDFKPEDFKHLKEQGTMDLQALLNKLEESSTKKSNHVHSDSDYSNKNYVPNKPKQTWANTSSSKSHVHSSSNYNNKNYVQDKVSSLNSANEKIVKRRLFDNRDTEPTIIRKDYD